MPPPYPFLGHGDSATQTLRVWLVASSPEAIARLGAECRALSSTAKLRAEANLLEIRATKAAAQVAAWLEGLTGVALVVRAARVKGTPWHRASLHDPRVFRVLTQVLRAAPTYHLEGGPLRAGPEEVTRLLFDSLKGRSPRAELLADVLRVLLDSAPGKSREVLMDQMIDQLPPLMGFDFDCDVVLRHLLGKLLKKSPHSIPVPPQFGQVMALRLGARSTQTPSGRLDWTDVGAVAAAIDGADWAALGRLDEREEPGVRTLLALSAQALRALAMSGAAMATRIANAAALRLAAGKFSEALQLFDAAVEGQLSAGAAANPLFAVQGDNHHLGIDEARARRYLERLLPCGPLNPTVFLNASFVFMELGEPERALEMLRAAAAHGLEVKRHRNEGLFAPLRERADFLALMGR